MGYTIVWWATLEILGLIALPIASIVLRGLPDRGYAVAKILGLLLIGWLAYMLAMIKVLPFGAPSLLICAAVVIVFSIWLLFRDGRDRFNSFIAHYRNPATWRYIATAEVLFTVALFVWAWARAWNPDIVDQEKFMDFGFMNSILKSGFFPPNDMWLAGASINYYYFGYVLIAALIALSGVPSEVAFNLAICAIFALTGLATFGIVYNMVGGTLLRRYARVVRQPRPAPARVVREFVEEPVVTSSEAEPVEGASPTLPVRRRRIEAEGATALATVEAPEAAEQQAAAPVEVVEEEPEEEAAPSGPSYEPVEDLRSDLRRVPFYLSPYPYAILAALMLVVMGNLTTMFTSHSTASEDTMTGNGFTFCFNCNRGASFDWWAPSRVIQDYRTNADGQKTKSGYENISEFPAFSFVLGDVHAHVIGLPLVLLAISFGLAITRRKILRSTEWRDGLPPNLLAWLAFALAALVLGSLYTTNTWDYPTYLLLFLIGIALPYLAAQRRGDNPFGWDWLRPWAIQSALLVILSLVLFLPFQLTFKSLVGGDGGQVAENIANIPIIGRVAQFISSLILVNTADRTILGFIVIFGIFLAAILVWIGYEFVSYLSNQMRRGAENSLIYGWAGAIVVIWVVAFLLKFPLLALLLPLIAIAVYLIWREPQRIERNAALAMFALAALVGLAIEVFFLRDNFQMRMNTIFKFYYQIWTLWALVAGYGLWRVLHAALAVRRTPQGEVSAPVAGKALAGVWALIVVALVLSGTLYSVYGVQSRQIRGQTVQPGLDGMDWLTNGAPGDLAAIRWLRANGTGSQVVLEAGSDEYQRPGRVSSYSGVPTLVAWDVSHEDLWRTNQPALLEEISTRRKVVNSIYQGLDPDSGGLLTADRLLALLHQYNVTYVFAGATERDQNGFGPQQPNQTMTAYAEGIFKQALPVIFQSGDTIIYSVGQEVSGTGVAPPTPGAPTNTPGGVEQPDTNAAPANLFDHLGASPNLGRFNLPRGIARDSAGNFYVSDTQNERIEVFKADGTFVTAFGSLGNGPGQFAQMAPDAQGTGPGGLAVDANGNIYVADTWNHRLLKFDNSGQFIASWGSFVNLGDAQFDNDADRDSRFFGPRGVAVGPDGLIYVTDTGNKRVLIFNADGQFQRKIDSGMSSTKTWPDYPFTEPGELNEPIGIAVGPDSSVYVADTNNKRIQKFDNSGKAVAQWPVPEGSWDPGAYLEPFLALDSTGNVYATAPTSKTVLKFSPTGELLGQKNTSPDGEVLQLPTGITVDGNGTVYVVDTNGSAVVNLGTIP